MNLFINQIKKSTMKTYVSKKGNVWTRKESFNFESVEHHDYENYIIVGREGNDYILEITNNDILGDEPLYQMTTFKMNVEKSIEILINAIENGLF